MLQRMQGVTLETAVQVDLANTGVTRATRIGLAMPNGPGIFAVLFAILRQRGTAAPLNPQFTKDELKALFTRIEPDLLVMQAPRGMDVVELLAHPGFQVARELGIRVALCHRETAGNTNGLSSGAAHELTNGAVNGNNKAMSNGVSHGVPEKASKRTGHGMGDGQDYATNKVEGGLRLTLRLFEGGDGRAHPVSPPTRAALFSQDEVRPEDTALVLSTSGTTGVPRAIPLSHANLVVAIRNIIASHQLSPADRPLITTQLYYVVGICGSILATLLLGGCAVIPEPVPDSFWQMCAKYGIT
jgi:oxalate---CoA ligase